MTPVSQFASRVTQNPQHMWRSRIWDGQSPMGLWLSTPNRNLLPLQRTPAQPLLTTVRQTAQEQLLSWILGARAAPILGRTRHQLRHTPLGPASARVSLLIPCDTAQGDLWQDGSFRASLTMQGHKLALLPNSQTTPPHCGGLLLPHRHKPRPV